MNQVEKAKISDVTQIHKLINGFADKGLMLARPLSELYESIRDFFVIREKGCGCSLRRFAYCLG